MLLTFDDGPDPDWTPRVLDALGDTRATFFVLGPRARANPEVIAAARAGGHSIELHGSAHLRHCEIDREQLRRDTYAALADLAAIGVSPLRWRTPWGVITDETRELAAELALELVRWTVDTHDWRGDSAEQMQAAIAPELRPDSVVLLHDALGPGAQRVGCGETVRLVEELVKAP